MKYIQSKQRFYYFFYNRKTEVNAAHKKKPYLSCGVIAGQKGNAYALFIHKKAQSLDLRRVAGRALWDGPVGLGQADSDCQTSWRHKR